MKYNVLSPCEPWPLVEVVIIGTCYSTNVMTHLRSALIRVTRSAQKPIFYRGLGAQNSLLLINLIKSISPELKESLRPLVNCNYILNSVGKCIFYTKLLAWWSWTEAHLHSNMQLTSCWAETRSLSHLAPVAGIAVVNQFRLQILRINLQALRVNF